MKNTKKQRKQIYLEAAMDFYENKESASCGICYSLIKYGLFCYNHNKPVFYIEEDESQITLTQNKNSICPEITDIVHDEDWYNNFNKDKNLRITALLLAAEMCN